MRSIYITHMRDMNVGALKNLLKEEENICLLVIDTTLSLTTNESHN